MPVSDKLNFTSTLSNEIAPAFMRWSRIILANSSSFKVAKTIPAEKSLTGEAYKVADDVVFATLKLDELAKIMREQRMNAGAISFDKVEVKFNLSEIGNPEGVYFKQSKDSNHLIEEFMLLANKKVAEYIGRQKKTFTSFINSLSA